MIVVDTHVIIWNALDPQKISTKAKKAIKQAQSKHALLASEISLWEIAMLFKRGRIQVDIDYLSFIKLIRLASNYQFVGITPEIADTSVNLSDEINRDPADRIICATAIMSKSKLITADKNLLASKAIPTLWS